ncbi:cortexin-2 isoform X2 [Sceloporus undulatus]|uniref:cortexin-2 isoform X2 n=1 Tax=Sceloporus undulatus TaxID=8520 RepID=UPI001C4D0048|nr:cortexin-2 isoform X2 [Sceloporus undulatus]
MAGPEEEEEEKKKEEEEAAPTPGRAAAGGSRGGLGPRPSTPQPAAAFWEPFRTWSGGEDGGQGGGGHGLNTPSSLRLSS